MHVYIYIYIHIHTYIFARTHTLARTHTHNLQGGGKKMNSDDSIATIQEAVTRKHKRDVDATHHRCGHHVGSQCSDAVDARG